MPPIRRPGTRTIKPNTVSPYRYSTGVALLLKSPNEVKRRAVAWRETRKQ